MTTDSDDAPLTCQLCGAVGPRIIQREITRGMVYTIAHCRACDVIQSFGGGEPVSPDYVDLVEEDIDDERIWCQGVHKQAAFEQWLKLVGRYAHGARTLLDIGCGTGGFLRFAQGHALEAYGFDASRAQVAYARREVERVEVATDLCEYAARAPYAPGRFDLITLWDVLEHVRTPKRLLQQIGQVLKPDGLLFASVPAGPLMAVKQRVMRALGRDLTFSPHEHVFYFSAASLRHYVGAWGLEVLQIGAVACYPRPMSVREGARRVGFRLLGLNPHMAPQIFVLARRGC